jgi:hypothetical protein
MSPKKLREMIFGVEIPNILNTNSRRFVENFQRAKRRLQHVLFLNPSSQFFFVILVLWTSRD